MTAALDRLREQIRDLTVEYVDEDLDTYRPLLKQLLYLGPFMHSSNEVVGKVQPRSTPPGNLAARDLYDHIQAGGSRWARELAGHEVRPTRERQPIHHLPDLAARVANNDERLHGEEGLYSAVGRWHFSVRVFLGYTKRPAHYPRAICGYCSFEDERGGSIVAGETLAWCRNRDCRDENGHRRDFTLYYLRSLLIESFQRDMEWATAATGVAV